MNSTLLEIGRLTVGQGAKQAVAVSKALGDAKDMTKVRKAPVPGYRWSKPDDPTAVEGGDKFALFGMKTEGERIIEKQIADRERAFAQRLADNRDQYNQQVKQWQDSVQSQRKRQVWDARKEYWGANISNAADKARGVGRVATGFIRTPAVWAAGFVGNGLTGARAAVADSRQETERLLIGDPNREMAARMGLEQAKAEAAKPMPVAPPPPELQVPNSFKPVPTTAEAAREMYRPRPKLDLVMGTMYGGETVQKPKLGPAPLPALPAPPALPKQPAIPASLKTTVSTAAEAIRARDATGPGPIKPIKIPDPPEKSGGLVKEANPIAAIYNIIKASRGVAAAGKFLAKHPNVADALGGVPGAAFGWYTTPYYQPDLTPGNMRTARTLNALFGYMMGRGGVRGMGYGPKLHRGQGFTAGASGMLLTNPAINAVNEVERSFKAMPESIEQAGKSVETASKEQGEAVGRKLLLAAGILAAGGLGATGYQALRDRKQDMARKGTIRVTLPTKRVGDTESTVDMPLDVLSNEAYKGIMRDTRRRVRAENAERVQRKGLALPAMQAGADVYDSFATPA